MQTSTSTPRQATPITHYENFPVASWLCPAHLRQPISAIYAFARTADDIADEGIASPLERLQTLHSYRSELHAIAAGAAPQPLWSSVFGPLQYHIHRHQLPVQLLDDLLSAFIQDIVKTRDGATYADRNELIDYCNRSANPVGRLLLHLYGVHDEISLRQSDAICTALQLINFWQDLSEDIPRGRHYLTDADCTAWNVTRDVLAAQTVNNNTIGLIASNADWARDLMQKGSPLALRLSGRIGWELRFVIQGGLCILDKVAAQQGQSLHTRLTIKKKDMPTIIWRALRM